MEIWALGDGLSQNADPLSQPNYYIDHLSRYNDDEICEGKQYFGSAHACERFGLHFVSLFKLLSLEKRRSDHRFACLYK